MPLMYLTFQPVTPSFNSFFFLCGSFTLLAYSCLFLMITFDFLEMLEVANIHLVHC